MAEILGPRELSRDVGARLFRFRGDLKKEFLHYHPHGEEIITAFTDGINAYISETEKDTSKLTIEFKLLGIKPGKWNPEDVISRHQGLLGNLPEEVRFVRAVKVLGEKKVKELVVFEPGDPDLHLDPKLDKANLFDSVISPYTAFRATLRIKPEDLVADASRNANASDWLTQQTQSNHDNMVDQESLTIGSNNWIVSGSRTESGMPILANDPHRAIAVPSLRYMVHLNGPGWNVLGAGEPTIPGVSIGHNENGAWGLTVFSIDGEDLYVYELNPKNQNQYRYKGMWEEMKIIADTIVVKGQEPAYVTHRFTRHGPVTFIDQKNSVAYAVRCAWLEPGGAPYLASLRIDQAKSWEEFREGCSFSNIPGENMIWADKQGNIGWQAVGIAPVRANWSGLVPVPGDGTYEWGGYLPIKSLPNVFNPQKGFWATANENLVPDGYANRNAVGWTWADRFRVDRINEALDSGKNLTQEDMMRLQFDYLSLPARALVPLLASIKSKDVRVEEARLQLLKWNYVVGRNSVEATMYVAWEKKLSALLKLKLVPEGARNFIRAIPLRKVVAWLTSGGRVFGNKSADRDRFLLICLEESLSDLEKKLGSDRTKWQYGQPAMHHVLIKHLLSNAVNDTIRKKIDLGPLPRGGYGSTPGVTSNNNNQTTGASFRMVVDTQDWDKAMFTNTPGQSGDPDSRLYRNLFEGWANDQHFPVYFSRDRLEKSAKMTILKPH